jgi:hypothetical protein
MNKISKTDERGRVSETLTDEQSGLSIVIGPPPGLVDEWPEPFATRLHNVLHARGILTYEDVVKKPNVLRGALQEALDIDVQILSQRYFEFQGK